MHSIYFDGSCLSNGLPGAKAGWGVVVKDDTGRIVFQSQGPVVGEQTNNRGEIMGLHMALEWLSNNERIEAMLYSDSKYVVDCVTGHSRRKANTDLWEPVEQLINDTMRQIISIKHISRENNSEADKLARVGANALI